MTTIWFSTFSNKLVLFLDLRPEWLDVRTQSHFVQLHIDLMLHRMQHQRRKCTIVDVHRCRGSNVGNLRIDRIYHLHSFASPPGTWISEMLQHHNRAPNLENHTVAPKKMTRENNEIGHIIGRMNCAINFNEPDRLMNWKLNRADTTVWNHVHRHNSKSLHNWPNHLICSIRIDGDILRSAAN